ncbi:MAG: DUF2330 domain-containing protein [Polyangiaceae bacterium]|nr:DUF2330 domain-containing protein [Polyangiaceae bacterium]
MRIVKALSTIPFLLIPILATADDAVACGGCFVQQTENTQVTGHRMVLGVSTTQTTLYDQITYSGAPEEFAWVLPIKGQVEVALSSDAMFAHLENITAVTVNSPQINCNPGGCPSFNGAGGSAAGGEEGGAGGGGVDIIAQQVVGPYETVQLSASDPGALANWLSQHGYNIPADIQPVIDAYVAEDFDFLALRLVPGEGIDSMRPVAITTPGAAPALPLRMVAAGTGAVTPITLWIVSEGRYEPQNFPSFLIQESQLVWNWDEQRSNYADLKQAGFASSNGSSWLVEAGEPLQPYAFESLLDLANYDPLNSGYANDDGTMAAENAQADIDRLTAGTDPASRYITRISAELARSALADDLVLQASPDQSMVNRYFFVQNTVGTAPECPPPPVCDDDGGWPDGDGEVDGTGGASASGGSAGCDSCAVGGSERTSLGAGLAAMVGLGLVLGRRRLSKR